MVTTVGAGTGSAVGNTVNTNDQSESDNSSIQPQSILTGKTTTEQILSIPTTTEKLLATPGSLGSLGPVTGFSSGGGASGTDDDSNSGRQSTPVDASDRKFYLQSPVPGALENFDADLALQTSGTERSGRSDSVGETSAGADISSEGQVEDALADYEVGPPTRPDIRHDNGHLQNPDDPSDPDPIDTIPPTQDDVNFYLKQVVLAEGGSVLSDLPFIDKVNIPFTDQDQFLDSPNGIDAYHHFLTGQGEDRQFSYDDFVSDDASGRVVLDRVITDTQQGVESIYEQMIADDPSLATQEVTFDVTGGAISVGGTDADINAYPDTDDWQKAIGAHTVWSSATVTVTPGEDGSAPTFEADFTLHGEDRYNFNPGDADIETGQADSIRGRLEQVGLAQQYDNFGTLDRNITWQEGQIDGSTSVSSGGLRN